MRHRKHTFKIGSSASHRRALIANMLKSLVEHGSIKTTVAKAKELRRHADKLITLAKKQTLSAKREASGRMMLRYNALTPKEARAAKAGDTSVYNADRKVIKKLFAELAPRFEKRAGGYTRIIKTGSRIGDQAPKCIIEYVE
jgi:large subunit ribosomal protein L17